MPRNVSGTYSLPLPPVVPNTTIATTWANPTLDDIAAALTDSLSRSGNGGMSAPFLLVDGTEAAPALAFSSSPGSGMWLDVNSLNFSYQGVSKLEIGASSIKGNVRFTTVDGDAAGPAYSFTSDTDTGMYLGGGLLNFGYGGASRGGFKNAPGFHVGDIAIDGASSGVGLYSRARLSTALTTQYGILEQTMFGPTATSAVYSVLVDGRFAAGAYVTPSWHGVRVTQPTLGAGQTLTSARGILVDDITGSGSGYGVFLLQTSGANKWALYSSGSARSYHEGALGLGIDPDTNVKLQVRGSTPAASPAWQTIDTAVFQATTNNIVQLHAGASGGTLGIGFSVAASRGIGGINYTTSSNTFSFIANAVSAFTISPTLVRAQVPFQAPAGVTGGLDVTGGITVTGGIIFTDSADLNVGGDLFVGLTASIGTTLRIGAVSSGTLGVMDVGGGPSGVTPNANADGIVLDSDINTGMSFLGVAGAIHQIRFGRTGANVAGGITYTHASDTFTFVTNSVTRLSLSTTAMTSTVPFTAPNLTSGTYTPVGTTGTNVTAVTITDLQYLRCGDVVTVSGRTTVTFTASGVRSNWQLTLPFGSNFAGASNQVGGTVTPLGSAQVNAGYCISDVATDRVVCSVMSEATGSQLFAIHFTYLIV